MYALACWNKSFLFLHRSTSNRSSHYGNHHCSVVPSHLVVSQSYITGCVAAMGATSRRVSTINFICTSSKTWKGGVGHYRQRDCCQRDWVNCTGTCEGKCVKYWEYGSLMLNFPIPFDLTGHLLIIYFHRTQTMSCVFCLAETDCSVCPVTPLSSLLKVRLTQKCVFWLNIDISQAFLGPVWLGKSTVLINIFEF